MLCQLQFNYQPAVFIQNYWKNPVCMVLTIHFTTNGKNSEKCDVVDSSKKKIEKTSFAWKNSSCMI